MPNGQEYEDAKLHAVHAHYRDKFGEMFTPEYALIYSTRVHQVTLNLCAKNTRQLSLTTEGERVKCTRYMQLQNGYIRLKYCSMYSCTKRTKIICTIWQQPYTYTIISHSYTHQYSTRQQNIKRLRLRDLYTADIADREFDF